MKVRNGNCTCGNSAQGLRCATNCAAIRSWGDFVRPILAFIALMTLWPSAYGQAIPPTVRAQIHCYCNGDPKPCTCTPGRCQCYDGADCRVTLAPIQAVPPEVATLQKDVADLKAQVAEIKAMLTAKQWPLPVDPPAVAPHLPNPPTPNCQCGCTRTGNCVCKDCDHPQLTAQKTVTAAQNAPAVAPATICGPNGCQVVGTYATQEGAVYYTSGASVGSCSTGASTGRIGLFRRRR